ncbi:asparagine synthase-related protein [Nonomuraea sp. LPB2021202275-12-8]|uniref:asparagine synthase-related protein n=1 Tax=Nonomuraea sp. LPB2021202275-12-8 TaxID=3120159 RepID=UPI00300D8EC6
MVPRTQTPSTTGADPALPPGLVATLADGVADARVYGAWFPDEVRRLRVAGRLLVIAGHCLADDETIRAGFAAAVEHDDPVLLTRWRGAYAGVAALPGELVAFTDLAGQFPLHYSHHQGQFALASHASVLAALHARTVDPIHAAVRIACPSVLPLWAEHSPFRGVSRLPGGVLLRAGRGGVRLSTYSAAAPSLRAALTEAVAARCATGPISADFSGGLDSTSLAFLAARQVRVEAIVYHHPQHPAADLAEAVAFARHDERLRLTTVTGNAGTLPYAALPYPELLGTEPARANLAWRRSLLRLEQAAALHLTGEGGDALLGAAPSYLGALARRGRWRSLARHCAGQARLRRTSALGLAVRAGKLAGTGPRRALLVLGRDLREPRPSELTWASAVTWWPVDRAVLSWLTHAARAEIADRLSDPGLAGQVDAGAGAAHQAGLTELRHSADAQRHLRELGVLAGTRVHAPYLDNAVVRACLAVPPERRAHPAVSKPLLGAALHDLVPRAVFARRTKGDYSAEEYQGARVSARRLYRLIDGSRLAELGVVEPKAVRESLDRLLVGAAAPLGGMSMFIATECWLRGSDDPHDW